MPIAEQVPERTDISEWAPSSAADLEAQREDTLARLMDRVEELERRMDAQNPVNNLLSSLSCFRAMIEDMWRSGLMYSRTKSKMSSLNL
jgi:hypothetical protein